MLSLFSFIQRHAGDGTRYGDAARYVNSRDDFPEGADYTAIEDYLRENDADPDVREVFRAINRGPYSDYRANLTRLHEALDIQSDVFEMAGCHHYDGALRSDFKRRPELLLLAAIARGLFDIADAIREN